MILTLELVGQAIRCRLEADGSRPWLKRRAGDRVASRMLKFACWAVALAAGVLLVSPPGGGVGRWAGVLGPFPAS